jgi:hypothetical protein
MTRLGQLEQILAIAEKERELLSNWEVHSMVRLQEERQRIIDTVQNLDTLNRDEQKVIERIIALDREIRILLVSKFTDVKEKIIALTHAKRILATYSPAHPSTTRRLSRRM